MQHMHSFPVTVLDNFFDDPDKIRSWALQQEYTPDPNGQWPGLRSKQIFELDQSFFHLFTRKVFSIFYNLSTEDVNWFVSSNFQIVNKEYESGWVHTDEAISQMTGIIYLNPNANLNSGTSIYRQRKDLLQHNYQHLDKKMDSYSNRISIQDAKKYKEQHNSQYEETIRVNNVYNRLIFFDSHLHHAAQDFFGENEDSRLTLTFFVTKLLVNDRPISRVRRVSE